MIRAENYITDDIGHEDLMDMQIELGESDVQIPGFEGSLSSSILLRCAIALSLRETLEGGKTIKSCSFLGKVSNCGCIKHLRLKDENFRLL